MEFEEACDGQDAIDRLEKTQYDLILMDCNMPNLSGLDAVRRIRSSGDQIPIILITGNREEEDILEAIKAGANNYVAKPFKLNVVERKIRDTLSSAQTEPGPSA
jgi:two-component system chemotaxis response regulator CheY